jgi:ribosomal protein S18 acetylase RimI-like enzyme
MKFSKIDNTALESLVVFFEELSSSKVDNFFHPHLFNARIAKQLCNYTGQDEYYVVSYNDKVVGYGFLRGWDDGFEIPGLGIVVSESVRGKGTGFLFMSFLHKIAISKGAQKVRLKVYEENYAALCLYKKIGYTFDSFEDGQLVGYIDLKE